MRGTPVQMRRDVTCAITWRGVWRARDGMNRSSNRCESDAPTCWRYPLPGAQRARRTAGPQQW
eukprot:274566-Prymnesium_polylepis.1